MNTTTLNDPSMRDPDFDQTLPEDGPTETEPPPAPTHMGSGSEESGDGADLDDKLDALEVLERQVKARASALLIDIDEELDALDEKREELMKRRDRLSGGPAPQRVAPDAPSVVHPRIEAITRESAGTAPFRQRNTFAVGSNGALTESKSVQKRKAVQRAAKAAPEPKVAKASKKDKPEKVGKMTNTSKVLAFFLQHKKSLVSEAAESLGLKAAQVSMILQRLKAAKAVEQHDGKGRAMRWSAIG